MSWTKTRSELANEVRRNPHADHTELRRQLKAEKLEDHIRQVVDAAPALTAEQRDHLSLVLRPAQAEAGDHLGSGPDAA